MEDMAGRVRVESRVRKADPNHQEEDLLNREASNGGMKVKERP